MPGFSYRISLVELDRDKLLVDLKESCRQALIKSARKFLLAAEPRIPQFTGFARGALGNLEDVAGRASGGKIDARQGGFTKARNLAKRKYYYYPRGGPRVIRNTITGRQFATASDQIFDQGRAKIAEGQTALFFKFTIDISYFTYLDREKWGAFKAGREAFDAELQVQLTRLLPRIGKYMIRRDTK